MGEIKSLVIARLGKKKGEREREKGSKKRGRDRDSEKETRNSARDRRRTSGDRAVSLTLIKEINRFFFSLFFPFTRLAYLLNSLIYFIAL